MTEQLRTVRRDHEKHTPHKRQNGRRNAKSNRVGNRIQFPSKITDGIGHAGNASVQAVEKYGNAQSLCRNSEVRVRAEISGLRLHCALKRLQGSQKAEENAPTGKQRG